MAGANSTPLFMTARVTLVKYELHACGSTPIHGVIGKKEGNINSHAQLLQLIAEQRQKRAHFWV